MTSTILRNALRLTGAALAVTSLALAGCSKKTETTETTTTTPAADSAAADSAAAIPADTTTAAPAMDTGATTPPATSDTGMMSSGVVTLAAPGRSMKISRPEATPWRVPGRAEKFPVAPTERLQPNRVMVFGLYRACGKADAGRV